MDNTQISFMVHELMGYQHDSRLEKQYKLQFSAIMDVSWKYPNTIGPRENKSKLLNDKSILYEYLDQLRSYISTKYQIEPKRIDFHIELTDIPNDPQILAKAKHIQGVNVNILDPNAWGYMGKALVLYIPTSGGGSQRGSSIQTLKPLHITVAYFKDQNNMPLLDEVRNMVHFTLDQSI
jgi:hypothetical protein